MMRKLLILVLCGFVQLFECSRVKFEPGFHEPMFRHDPHMQPESVRREHFYPRESIVPADQLLMRGEPMYGNEPMVPHPPPPQQAAIPSDNFLSNPHLMQAELFSRREPFLRREPIFKREPFRDDPMIRGRAYQNPVIFREGAIFRSEPNTYTFMVSQCPYDEPQNLAQAGAQESFFQISQPIQSMHQQQPIVTHRLLVQKSLLKPPACPPIVAFPRIQGYMRKSFKPMAENIQFPAPAAASPPVQEFNSFTNEPVSFPGNFQNQGQQPESTSESVQNNPATARSVPQIPSALTLAHVSSIC